MLELSSPNCPKQRQRNVVAAALQAVAVKDLKLPADSSKLQLAFALWAEGLATTVPSAQQKQQPRDKQGAGSSKQQQQGGKKGKRPADAAAAAAAGEETATSTGTARPSKKAKA
jgi:hypothetical protein